MKAYPDTVEEQMRAFFQTLSEKDKRRYAAVEAAKLGHGGITYIAAVLGCSIETIRRGQKEFTALRENELRENELRENELRENELRENEAPGRIRRQGGGRKPYTQTHPDIDAQFLSVIDDYTAGDPMQNEVRWPRTSHKKKLPGDLKSTTVQRSRPRSSRSC